MASNEQDDNGPVGDEPDAPERDEVEAAYGTAGVPGGGEVPPIDFNTFILSLSSTALLNLGVGPDPTTGETAVHLPLARQTIDLIAVLEEKTKGNLTGEEERLLGQVLYDLRMRYVAATKR